LCHYYDVSPAHPLRRQRSYPKPASPAPWPRTAFRHAAAPAVALCANGVGGVAARGGSAAGPPEPRNTQRAAGCPGDVLTRYLRGAGLAAWRRHGAGALSGGGKGDRVATTWNVFC